MITDKLAARLKPVPTKNREMRIARDAFLAGAQKLAHHWAERNLTMSEVNVVCEGAERAYPLTVTTRPRVLRWYNDNYRVRGGKLEIERYTERAGAPYEQTWAPLGGIEGELLDPKFFKHLLDLMEHPNEEVEAE